MYLYTRIKAYFYCVIPFPFPFIFSLPFPIMLSPHVKLGIASAALTLLAVLGLVSFHKTHDPTVRAVNPAFSAYIYAYTGGEVSRVTPIRVRLNEAAATIKMIGKDVESGVFGISPSVAGKAVWEDAHTIKFTPDAVLVANKTYTGSVQVGKLYPNVDKKLYNFEWDFRSKRQTIGVQTDGFETTNAADLTKQSYSGVVNTGDYAENDLVEQSFFATQTGNTALEVKWTHADDHRAHRFTIKNIQRGTNKSELKLVWNGQRIDSPQAGEKAVEVAAANDFKVIDAVVVPDNQAYVVVHCSEPLLANQNLEGLVTAPENSFTSTINGNQIIAYPAKPISGKAIITVNAGIKNAANKKIENASKWNLEFSDSKPQVRLLGKGVVIPNSTGLLFPFEAVNLKAVDIEIFKIYQNNVLNFLQANNLDDGGYEMQRFGHIVLQKRVDMDNLTAAGKNGKWTRYALDLKSFIKQDPGAMYQVRIGFRREYSTYPCLGATATKDKNAQPEGMSRISGVKQPFVSTENENTDDDEPNSIMGYNNYEDDEEDEGNGDGARENPCSNKYYNRNRFIQRNVLASDLGMIVKRANDGNVAVAVTDIGTTDPMKGVKLELYDQAQQLVGTGATDGNGLANIAPKRKPYFLIATSGEQRGYLRLDDGNSLSLSSFEVDGTTAPRGLKGYLYGERGVWRPGDSLYLTFVLQDKSAEPVVHPVTLELYDPRGQLQRRITKVTNEHGLYDFSTNTDEGAPTGTWTAKVLVGGAKFEKSIKIETVKPNRLKLNLNIGKEQLMAADSALKIPFEMAWLHGAIAKDLKATVEMTLTPIKTDFGNGYKDYNFDDPTRHYKAEAQTIFDGKVNAEGKATVSATIDRDGAPGMMKAWFYVRGFERGGDFSFTNVMLPYSPYSGYVGIAGTQKNGRRYVEIGKPNTVRMVTLSEKGKPETGHRLAIKIYRVRWNWWWDNSGDTETLDDISTNKDIKQVAEQDLTSGANGTISYAFTPTDWGRYLVRVVDKTTGHSSAIYMYSDYYGGESEDGSRDAAAMLAIETDKKAYNVGETVTLKIPTGEKGRALVSIENGSRILQQFWVNAVKGENKISFKTTEDMAPNVYASVTLIQPHAQVQNDLPIRLYGVVPVVVENPAAHLTPVMEIADVLKPETPTTIKIRELGGKAMAYTIDIVDDGLLDLTAYKTADPYKSFFAREALGVKTWDIYDYVLGAFGGVIEHILSIGGDEAASKAKGRKANRFKPVVLHLGPFYVAANKTATHTITLPNYVGSCRVMVVAASGNAAFGAAEKTVAVRKPLMVLATAPRMLAPSETFTLPCEVFAMEQKVKNVHLQLTANDAFEVLGGNSKDITFNEPGDELINFQLKVKDKIGIGKITVVATGGGETATQTIELDVRNPNPEVTTVAETVLDAGQSWDKAWDAVGVTGSNSGMLELSTIPPINLQKHLRYLLTYPHGCIEQTTSSGLPQLNVGRIINLSPEQKATITTNVKATIQRIASEFQTADGGFGYWPGDAEASSWGSSYAGHFLLEAQAAGYTIPSGVLEKWIGYQQKTARSWQPPQRSLTRIYDHGYGYTNDLSEAYCLYTLALAKQPDIASMNRLREFPDLSIQGKWRLAAAYGASGKPDIGAQLVKGLSTDIKPYKELSNTFGSDVRDLAMILETLTTLNDNANASALLLRVANAISDNKQWYSTQTTAYGLMAICKFVGNGSAQAPLSYTYQITSGAAQSGSSDKFPLVQLPVKVDGNTYKKVAVTNTGKGKLFARLILSGQPKMGDTKEEAANMTMNIAYKNAKDEVINPNVLEQGTDFIAEVTITNPGLRGNYDELALTQVFPAGWEIRNSRLASVNANLVAKQSKADYQDIRDDRVMTYFDLRPTISVTYRVQLNASYQGRYYLPTTYCEAMYDASVHARKGGGWVEVRQSGEGTSSVDTPDDGTEEENDTYKDKKTPTDAPKTPAAKDKNHILRPKRN